MNPIEPWVDVDELRRMADVLLSSPNSEEKPSEALDDAVFGSSFEGYEVQGEPAASASPEDKAEPVEASARHSLAAARELAQRGGLLNNQAPDKSEESRVEANDSISEVTASTTPAAEPVTDKTRIVAQFRPLGPWLQ